MLCPPLKMYLIKNNNPLVDLPLSVESIIDCDAVIITHTHRDHFDDAAAKLLPKEMTIFCQPEDEQKLEALGFKNVTPVISFVLWQGIRIDRTKGKHGHGDIAKQMAPVSGFVIKAPNEPCVYITGDTVWCSYVEKALEKYNPEIVVSYCGEAKFSKGKAITMDASGILSICQKQPSAKVIAVHMESWNHCRLNRKVLSDFIVCNNIENKVFIPKDGEILSF